MRSRPVGLTLDQSTEKADGGGCLKFITKTHLFKYIGNFSTKKTENFQIKNSDIFHICAQNIDCRYSLEPPRRGGSNEYYNLCF